MVPATEPLPDDEAEIKKLAKQIGYPVMLKASWGGGGRGMRPIEDESTLIESVHAGKRESKAAFGRDEVYLEIAELGITAGSGCAAGTVLDLAVRGIHSTLVERDEGTAVEGRQEAVGRGESRGTRVAGQE